MNDAVVILRDQKTDDARLLRDANDEHARSNGIELPGLEERSVDPAVVWMRDARGGIAVDLLRTRDRLMKERPFLSAGDALNEAAVIARNLRPTARVAETSTDTSMGTNATILRDLGLRDSDALNCAWHLAHQGVEIERVDGDQLVARLAAGDGVRVALGASLRSREQMIALRAGR